MDSSEEEKRKFSRVISILITPEEGITSSGVLSQETIEKVLPAHLFFFNTLSVAYLNHLSLQIGALISYADGS